MDNIPMFGRRKNGEESIEYPHPLLEPVLNETYGIFVYQEQVMQAAQILAGYSLGEADLLRRAMGKKIQAEMDAQRERFVTGCATHAILPTRANELFDLIDKFAGYGFNKSHAAAYAVLAYQTAWLKTHHPEEFYAASMCFDMHQTDKLAIFMDDMRRLEVSCLAPDINRSEAEFSVETDAHGEHAVRYALGGIKNVGERAMEILVTERTTAGLFKSLDDFANRVDPSQINRRSLENLAAAGAFDALEPNRGAVHAAAETLLAAAQSARDSRESGQGGLFGEGGSDMAALRIDNSLHWAPGEQMNQEKDAFGFYFSAHPCSQYDALASSHGAKPYAVWLDSGPIPEGVRRAATMSALIEGVRWRESRKGKRFMIADFSDISGQFSVRCFDETIGMQLAEWAKDAECLLLHCEMDMRPGDETPSFTVKSAKPLSGLTSVSRLKIKLDVTHEAALSRLAEMVAPLHGGRSELVIKTRADDGRFVHIVLGRRFQIDASLLDQVRTIDGIENVELAPLGPLLALVH
jgi:DNA polymerase-3 subunit alpha